MNSLERCGNPVAPGRGIRSWEPRERLVGRVRFMALCSYAGVGLLNF